MRRLLAGAALAITLAGAGCACPDTSEEIGRLRVLHAQYRAAVVPRPDLDPEKVDALGQKIDQSFAVLQQIEDER